MPQEHDVVASLRVKRQELLEEVGKMQVRGCACHIPLLFHIHCGVRLSTCRHA